MKIFSLFCLISLTVTLLSPAEAEETQTKTIHYFSEGMSMILERLPDSALKAGVEHYLKIIGTRSYGNDSDVGDQNKGIVDYYGNLFSENPCFTRITEGFYQEIRSLKIPQSLEDRKISLAVESGHGGYSDFSPGWSYRKALEYAGGSPNIAFALLGACGHDDIGQNSQYSRGGQEQYLECPSRSSVFFAAKALGTDVDISEELKDKIVAVQAPVEGREELPGKNYHFMGAAFMACELVGKGVSPKMAVIIQKLASWVYRTVRMNHLISKYIPIIEELESEYKTFARRTREENRRQTLRGRTRGALSKKIPSFEEWLFEKMREEEGSSLDIQTFRDTLTKLDAAKVFDSMSLGGWSLGGIPFPHTNIIKLSFFGDPVTRHIRLKERRQQRSSRRRHNNTNPMGWPQERYRRAKEKALTYLVDWEWTVKQHEIGASFAANLCQRQSQNFKPDDIACTVSPDIGERVCDDYLEEHDDRSGTLFDTLFDDTQEALDFEMDVEKTNEGLLLKGVYPMWP